MLPRSVRLTVHLALVLSLFIPIHDAFPLCGDADGNSSVSVSDAIYVINWLRGTGPAPADFNEADSDNHAILTIRDVAYIFSYIFQGGAAPICPPGLARYQPTNNSNLDVTHSGDFPADVTTTNVGIFLTNSVSHTPFGLSLPLKVTVGGQAPASLSLTTLDKTWPGTEYGEVNIVGGPDGNFLILGFNLGPVAPGTYRLGTLTINMPSSDPLPRPVELTAVLLPPIQSGVGANELMIVNNNLVGSIPSINGVFPTAKTGFFANPRNLYVGKPVFFSGVASEPVSAWDWDFGDGSPHGTSQNPVHVYATAGLRTVSLIADLTAGGSETTTKPNYINVLNIKADFSASQRAGVAPLTVNFTDLSLGSPDTWLWDFGEAPGQSVQNPSHVYSSPGTYTVSLTSSLGPAADSKIWVDCIRVDAVATPDLEVRVIGEPIPRPGFIKNLHLIARNLGSADAGGTLRLDLSAYPVGTGFVGSTPAPDVNLNPIFEWNLPTLSWDPTQSNFDDYEVTVQIQVAVGTPAGTALDAVATIPAVAGELVTLNNTFVDHEEVRTAIDPNDKLIQPVCGQGNFARGTERIQYTIFFENKPEATAAATYVLVVDTLDTRLDLGSFALGPSSHESVLEFNLDPVTREATWFFDGINLAPNTTPPIGEGFVSFTISPEPGQPDGTVIPNRAYIRFDFENWLAAPDTGAVTLTIANADVNSNGLIDDCEYVCGDADGSGSISIADAVYLINYIFAGGPAPVPLAAGDADCSGAISIADAVYLINYIFSGGAAPCAACP